LKLSLARSLSDKRKQNILILLLIDKNLSGSLISRKSPKRVANYGIKVIGDYAKWKTSVNQIGQTRFGPHALAYFDLVFIQPE